ncbi:MAG: GDP-mannose 4,6-dehydratase [Patescibacteria group bacterium]
MKIFITGGAGFIGINLARHHLLKGDKVKIFDNFSRKGSQANAGRLVEQFGRDNLIVVPGDVAHDFELLKTELEGAEIIYHCAGQVAVTHSFINPRLDFEANALGTFNTLEALRLAAPGATLIYSSTNKVYGGLEDVTVVEEDKRYRFNDFENGIPETRQLDFHSPYGVSKGAGDQYVRDYARMYGLNTVVFRKSCIYGPHQMGVEDQGWVAWFALAAHFGKPITIYGNGKQVRDVLHISDLINAYQAAHENIATTKGQIYNIGGGPDNTLSLIELIALLEQEFGRKLEHRFTDWRPGDQPVYISDITKAKNALTWQPAMTPAQGVKQLVGWIKDNESLYKQVGIV